MRRNRHLSVPPAPGPTSYAPRPTPCWRATSLETVTASVPRMYVFVVIEHASRQIRILGANHKSRILLAADGTRPTGVRWLIYEEPPKDLLRRLGKPACVPTAPRITA